MLKAFTQEKPQIQFVCIFLSVHPEWTWFGKDLFSSLQVLGIGVINLLTSTWSLWTNPDLELRVRPMPKQNPADVGPVGEVMI